MLLSPADARKPRRPRTGSLGSSGAGGAIVGALRDAWTQPLVFGMQISFLGEGPNAQHSYWSSSGSVLVSHLAEENLFPDSLGLIHLFASWQLITPERVFHFSDTTWPRGVRWTGHVFSLRGGRSGLSLIFLFSCISACQQWDEHRAARHSAEQSSTDRRSMAQHRAEQQGTEQSSRAQRSIITLIPDRLNYYSSPPPTGGTRMNNWL